MMFFRVFDYFRQFRVLFVVRHDLESYSGTAAGVSDKLQFVAGFGKRLLAGTSDKLKFVGHFLAAFLITLQVVVLSIAVVALSLDVGSDGASAQVAAPKLVDGGSPVYRATLELSDYNLVFTPVKINGQEARALIDSGHFRSVQLSSTAAQSLKLALTKTDETPRHHDGKDLSLASGRIDSLAIGDYEWRDVEVGVIEGDVEKIAAQVGTKFDVILGWGFISEFHMSLDYKRLSMQFGKRPLAAGRGAFSLKYSVVNRAPVVRGSLGPGNNEEANFLFDTGAPMCNLDLDLANAPKGAKVSRDLTLAERRFTLEFRARDLTVIRKSLGCVGVIGNNLLRQYAVYFDPDAKMIHLSSE